MESNEKILANWKPIHEKGLAVFVVPYALRLFTALALIVTIIFLINRQKDTITIGYMIVYNTVFYIFVIVGRVYKWFRKEKQYMDILNLFEMINKCPACSAKTSSEDKICPSCGLILKM